MIGQVKENRITNDSIQEKLYHIPTVRNQIAICQLTFVGKKFNVETLTSQPIFLPLCEITR